MPLDHIQDDDFHRAHAKRGSIILEVSLPEDTVDGNATASITLTGKKTQHTQQAQTITHNSVTKQDVLFGVQRKGREQIT